MENKKQIKLNMDFINNDAIISDRQVNIKQPEKIIRNLEPKDNMKRINHNRLMKSKHELNLKLDLDNLEINKDRQIQKNNLYEKNAIKSLTELNTKKTFGIFNNEKEKIINKENLFKKRDDPLFNGLNNNIIIKNENNNYNELQMLSLDYNNFNNNNIEFNDNKFVNIKNRRNMKLLKNKISKFNYNIIY